MGVVIKEFNLNKLSDLLSYISDDIDEDDMQQLKEHIKKFKDQIKDLKGVKKEKIKLEKEVKALTRDLEKVRAYYGARRDDD